MTIEAVSTVENPRTSVPPPPPPPEPKKMSAAHLQGEIASNEARAHKAKDIVGAKPAPASSAPPAPRLGDAPPASSSPAPAPASTTPSVPVVPPSAKIPDAVAKKLPPGVAAPRPAGNPIVEAATGVKDGVVDTAKGIVSGVKTLWRVATDKQLRADISAAAAEARKQVSTGEGQKATGEAIFKGAQEGAKELWARAKENPGYAAGYVAGALLTGGALKKGITLLGQAATKIPGVGQHLQRAGEFVQAHKKAAIAVGAATAAGATASTETGRDAAGVVYHSNGTALGAGVLLTPQGRALAKGAKEHLGEVLRSQP
jgi:hypothetical protein